MTLRIDLRMTLIAVTGTAVLTSGAAAEVVGLTVEEMDFSAGYVRHDNTLADPSGNVTAAWPAFSAQYDVFRVYAVVDDPNDRVAIAAGSPDNDFPLMLSSTSDYFWNHASGLDTPPNEAWGFADGTILFDSYVTISRTDNGAPNATVLNGPVDLSGNFEKADIGWFVDPMAALAPVAVGDGTYRVLLCQLTVLEGDYVSGQILVSGPGLGTDNFFSFSNVQADLDGVVVEGDAAWERFGWSVASAGDTNGDGFTDFVVGAPFAEPNGPASGRAELYSGLDGALLFTFDGQSAGARFGWSVSGAGDVNGDGYDDVVISAPREVAKRGAVYIYNGRSGALIRKISGEVSSDQFGYSVSGGIDYNRDGLCDVIVGAPYNDDVDSKAGKVYVFDSNGNLLDSFVGENREDRFGYTVVALHRTIDSLRGDIAVGAPWVDDAGSNSGKVYVFKNKSGAVRFTEVGTNPADKYGYALADAGRIDGDTYGDLVVASPFWDRAPGRDAGRIEVLSGKRGGRIFSKKGSKDRGFLGYAVGGRVDIDGDGWDEVIIGSPFADENGVDSGQIDIRSGADFSLLDSIVGSEADVSFGFSLAGVRVGTNVGALPYVVSAAPYDSDVADYAGVAEVIAYDSGAAPGDALIVDAARQDPAPIKSVDLSLTGVDLTGMTVDEAVFRISQ